MFCPSCGSQLASGAAFCSRCGNPAVPQIPEHIVARGFAQHQAAQAQAKGAAVIVWLVAIGIGAIMANAVKADIIVFIALPFVCFAPALYVAHLVYQRHVG